MKVPNTLLALGLMAAISPAATQSFAQTANIRSATPIAASAPTAVPALVPFSGAVIAPDGKTFAEEAGVTFQIYKDEVGGEALWTETQTVAIDSTGHYKVQLGAANPNGLPSDLFASGDARWLEAQIAGEAPQPRVLLVSVPYALKAADAATLGGLPASAFALARPVSGVASAVSSGIAPSVTSNVTTTGGTLGFVPQFSGASSVVDSPIFVNTTGEVGVGTAAPGATLDVDGTALVEGALTVNGSTTFNSFLFLSPRGTATTATSFNSQYIKVETSAYNSSTKAVVNPRFQLQAEAHGNDTASPTATLNLLSTTGTGSPTETGFSFNASGTINFAPGQTFPGADITGVVNASGYNIGGSPFATGSASSGNGFFGFSGNSSVTGGDNVGAGLNALTGLTTGNGNVAAGAYALHGNTTGGYNSAVGYGAAYSNTTANFNAALGADALYFNTGSNNTGVGTDALFENKTGSDNTGLGSGAGPDSSSGALTNTTAIGSNSTVSQSNSLILGQTTAGNPGNTFVNVGIGTATPISSMDMSVSSAGGVGADLTLTNPGANSDSGGSVAIDFNTQPIPSSGYVPGARIQGVEDADSTNLEFLTSVVGPLQTDMQIFANGEIYISNSSGGSLHVLGGTAESDAVEAFGAPSDDAFYGAGGDASTTTDNGGNGGDFYGGNAESGTGGDGIYASPGLSNVTNGYAGYFAGNVHVTGALSVSGVKNFKIDDPVDPANKYLVHASVESSEMMNIYSGNVTTDDLGFATVTLPAWFQSENGDFRYQLTVIGGRFAQAVVSKEIANNQFTISTNATGVKVSWQVTAVRQDAYAKANPMVVEEIKPANERGFYEHPEYYGQPASKQAEWGRHPLAMQQAKAQREKAKLKQSNRAKTGDVQPHTSLPASAVNRNFPHPAAPAIQPHASGAQLKPINQTENK